MIQMLSPSSAGLQLSTRGKEREGWTKWEDSPGVSAQALPYMPPPSSHKCTSLFLTSMPVQQSGGSFVGKGRD